MKNLIVLVTGLLLSTGVFAKENICHKQATIAAQGIANANPQYEFGKVILKEKHTDKNEVTTYKFLPSSNDGFILVVTTPSTDTTCDVSEASLYMP